jgi:radical SAM superfamily enzyme YgiQ (UPF0313 family)
VVLIGFQDQGNLGMGYLASSLLAYGHPVELIEFRDDAASTIARVCDLNPVVVGFSLIFQYYLPDYRTLIQRLRAAGVDAHFTMGGHYPSLCPDDVLSLVPELDSVALYEGELTLVELTATLRRGEDWHAVPGLAWLQGNRVTESPARALAEHLDDLPLPLRTRPPERVLGWPTLPLLASRGCARRCSFCSIHTFYRGAPGRTVRVRAPAKVADEMELLADTQKVRIFLFQDDDFPLAGRPGQRFVAELTDEIRRRVCTSAAYGKLVVARNTLSRRCSPRCARRGCTWSTWAWSPAATRASRSSTSGSTWKPTSMPYRP